ncbi:MULTISPECIES: hypothetical protein [Oxalobacteraceae]|uniref:hypothetical protein n=1 Tax=Herminiimonas sp. Marseille-P9896 TaxID=2742211 RepID=UPI00158E7EF6|nr:MULTISPECIES: hypothetical protein [Oxalobacteraceae]
MQKLFICLVALAISGCATKKLSEVEEQRIRNVGVVSIISEDASFQKIGLTVFNNEKTVIEMNGQVAATVFSIANAQLTKSRPNWVVKRVVFEQSAMIKKLNASGMVMSSPVEKIQKDLGEIAKSNGLDALLVFFPVRYESVSGEGVGVMLRTMSLSSVAGGFAYATIDMAMIDQRGEIVAYAGTGSILASKAIDIEGYGIKYSLNANTTPEVTDKLKTDIKDLLKQNVTIRLGQIGL